MRQNGRHSSALSSSLIELPEWNSFSETEEKYNS